MLQALRGQQQPHVAAGGIVSGYPVRTQPQQQASSGAAPYTISAQVHHSQGLNSLTVLVMTD